MLLKRICTTEKKKIPTEHTSEQPESGIVIKTIPCTVMIKRKHKGCRFNLEAVSPRFNSIKSVMLKLKTFQRHPFVVVETLVKRNDSEVAKYTELY